MDIQNYKDLLIAIFNTDEESNKKSVICVYDTKEDDRLIAIFNSTKSCGEFFNTTKRAIEVGMWRKRLRNGRYRLERVNLSE